MSLSVVHIVGVVNKDDVLFDIISSLCSCMYDKGILQNIVTFQSDLHFLGNVEIHTFSNFCNKTKAEFKSLLTAVQADVIHIHGCWDKRLMLCEKWAKESGLYSVVSPYGALNPEIMRINFFPQRIMNLMLFQYKAIKEAGCVVACSSLEYITLYELNWNQAIISLKNPRIEPTCTYMQLCQSLISIYEKVVATYSPLFISSHALKVVFSLLYVGAAPDNKSIYLNEDYLNAIRETKDKEWRTISLYGELHGINNIMQKALQRLHFDRMLDVCKPEDRLRSVKPLNTDRINFEHLIYTDLVTNHKLLNIAPGMEKTILIMMLNIRHEYQKGQLSLRHLTEMYATLRYNDFDENLFGHLLEQFSLRKFASHIEAILHVICFLEEGYMPIPPTKDKKTVLMKQNILSITIK